MLIFLPLAAFGVGFLLLLAKHSSKSGPNEDWRGAFLKAAIAWGAGVAVLSEGLGLFGALRLPWIALGWFAVLITLAVLGVRRGILSIGWRTLASVRVPEGRWDRGLLGGLAALLLALLVVAWISPPNNVDSLLYHMSRVMHWIQNGSLRHYAASYHHQLFMPPWAEMAILHLRVLWGSDKPVNLIQWFSLIGSLIGVSAIAKLLGADRRGQSVAAVFAATVPMGVLQATSTQNDFVVAFWAVCVAYLVTLSFSRPLSRGELTLLGVSLGLGVLTKVTFFVYGAPIAGAFLVANSRGQGLRRTALATTALAVLVGGLNLPTWVRNVTTYGGPYGPVDWSAGMLATPVLLEGLRELGSSSTGSLPPDSPGAPSRVLRAVGLALIWPLTRIGQAAALNLVTPSSLLNRWLWAVLDAVPAVFDQVVSHSLEQAAWSHEDSAGNPFHLLLVIVSTVLILVGGRKQRGIRASLPYLVMVGLTFVLLPMVIQRGSSGFGIRYQLPFFILWAPLMGPAFRLPRLTRWTIAAGLIMLISALPYLLFNNTRPIIGRPPWPTRVRSVFVAPADEIMFAINPDKRDSYRYLADVVRNSGCRAIGLRLDSSDLEYQFWWILDAPQSGYRLETIYTYPILEDLLDREFTPCAVICTICGERIQLGDLIMKSDFAGARLFISPAEEADS